MPLPALRVENLATAPEPSPAGPVSVLTGLNFELHPGEQVAILGARGAGKTALIRAVALLQKPGRGRVFFEGEELTRLPEARLRSLRRHFQVLSGHPARALVPHLSVAETLRAPLAIHRLGAAPEQQARLEAALAKFELNRWLLTCPVSTLSLAMRERIMLARAFVLEPRLLICDELIEHLEPSAAGPLLGRLAALCRAEGITWLWTTSSAALAEAFSDRRLKLEGGQLSRV